VLGAWRLAQARPAAGGQGARAPRTQPSRPRGQARGAQAAAGLGGQPAGGLHAALLSGWAGARPRRRLRCAARPPAGASAQRPTEAARYDSIFDFYFS